MAHSMPPRNHKSIAERLDQYTMPEPMSGCWLWTGQMNRDGYGCFQIMRELKSTRLLAHRAAYEHHVRAIPDGLALDHLCRNKLCVNPDHLEPVTHEENSRRAYAHLTHCGRGHPYGAKNSYFWKGRRFCRACNVINQMNAKRRRRTRQHPRSVERRAPEVTSP